MAPDFNNHVNAHSTPMSKLQKPQKVKNRKHLYHSRADSKHHRCCFFDGKKFYNVGDIIIKKMGRTPVVGQRVIIVWMVIMDIYIGWTSMNSEYLPRRLVHFIQE